MKWLLANGQYIMKPMSKFFEALPPPPPQFIYLFGGGGGGGGAK